VDFSNSKDERLLSFYENIRSQVEAERYFAYRFTTGSVRQYVAIDLHGDQMGCRDV
jgi:hypothetical protein